MEGCYNRWIKTSTIQNAYCVIVASLASCGVAQQFTFCFTGMKQVQRKKTQHKISDWSLWYWTLLCVSFVSCQLPLNVDCVTCGNELKCLYSFMFPSLLIF